MTSKIVVVERFDSMQDFLTFSQYSITRTKKGRLAFERKIKALNAAGIRLYDDIPHLRYLCAVLLVTRPLEALFVRAHLCCSQQTTMIADANRVILRSDGVGYLIPVSAMVNRNWFRLLVGKQLLDAALWDLINRSSQVQEYVDERNRKEMEASDPFQKLSVEDMMGMPFAGRMEEDKKK